MVVKFFYIVRSVWLLCKYMLLLVFSQQWYSVVSLVQEVEINLIIKCLERKFCIFYGKNQLKEFLVYRILYSL